jgi:hypothetical protein
MPYCSQCSAEYAEGTARCLDCGRSLVALPQEVRSRTAPSPLRQYLTGSALGYALGSARLLWRRPGLMVLPLLAVCFNVLEGTASRQLLVRYTVAGRALVEDSRAWVTDARLRHQLTRQELAPTELTRRTAESALGGFGSPVPAPGLTGTAELIYMAATEAPEPEDGVWVGLAENAALSIVLVLPLQALFLAFYYERLRAASEPAQGTKTLAFLPAARRNYGRFLLYLALLTAVSAGLWALCFGVASDIAKGVLGSPDAPGPVVSWSLDFVQFWLVGVLLLPLALALVAMVQDRVGIFQAVRRGAVTFLRQLPTALVLLVLSSLPLAAVHTFRAAVALWLDYLPTSAYLATPPFGSVVLQAVSSGLLVPIGVWLALAQFLWYREANPVP